MSISAVSSATPQFQATIAAVAQQPKDAPQPPAAKALDAVNAQMESTLASVSSGIDISV